MFRVVWPSSNEIGGDADEKLFFPRPHGFRNVYHCIADLHSTDVSIKFLHKENPSLNLASDGMDSLIP